LRGSPSVLTKSRQSCGSGSWCDDRATRARRPWTAPAVRSPTRQLDGDGRLDLVSITLDFSVLPLLARMLVVRRLSLRLDFHPWCQQEDGRLVEVAGLDLVHPQKPPSRDVSVPARLDLYLGRR